MSPASSNPATSRPVSRTVPASARRLGGLVPAGTAATPPLVSMMPVLYAYVILWAVLRHDPGVPHVIRLGGLARAGGGA
jgi:hypothetical protein